MRGRGVLSERSPYASSSSAGVPAASRRAGPNAREARGGAGRRSGISDSCLRNWLTQADRDEGRRSDGLSTAERDELVRLRRELRVAKLEVEILKRAAAYFAQENVLQ